MARIAYSPAIDGMRAVAVLAVVAYHAGAPMQSGFVGVDIFFVISGYLITKLLYHELTSTGRIDFLGFYARRARRILPALVAVIIATFLVVRLALPMTDQQDTAKAAAASLLFAGNVFFYVASSGYFELDTAAAPLLHLWSLGVEEQFYLVWPLALLAARRRAIFAVSMIAGASFALAEFWIPRDPDGAFYLAHTRAWELAAGGLVALRQWRMPRGAALGALCIVLVSCWYDPPHFPGAGALPAVAGSAMLIAAIQDGQRCSLLEWKPMVGIGLISYSLYLWHWPILVLGRLILGNDTSAVALVAASFVLAFLSYQWVEMPFRRVLLPKPRAAVIAVAVSIVIGVSASLVAVGTAKDQPWVLAPSLKAHACDSWVTSAEVKPCVFGPESAPRTAVLIGDSVGVQWFPAIYRILQAPDWRMVVLTKSACPLVDKPIFYGAAEGRYVVCEEWRKGALAYVSTLRPDLIIAGSTDTYAYTRDEWLEGSRAVLTALSASAGAVRVFGATPHRTGAPPRSHEVNEWLEEAAKGLENVAVVTMADATCPVRCQMASGGREAFHDEVHLRADYVLTLVPILREKLNLGSLGRPPLGNPSPGERSSQP